MINDLIIDPPGEDFYQQGGEEDEDGLKISEKGFDFRKGMKADKQMVNDFYEDNDNSYGDYDDWSQDNQYYDDEEEDLDVIYEDSRENQSQDMSQKSQQSQQQEEDSEFQQYEDPESLYRRKLPQFNRYSDEETVSGISSSQHSESRIQNQNFFQEQDDFEFQSNKPPKEGYEYWEKRTKMKKQFQSILDQQTKIFNDRQNIKKITNKLNYRLTIDPKEIEDIIQEEIDNPNVKIELGNRVTEKRYKHKFDKKRHGRYAQRVELRKLTTNANVYGNKSSNNNNNYTNSYSINQNTIKNKAKNSHHESRISNSSVSTEARDINDLIFENKELKQEIQRLNEEQQQSIRRLQKFNIEFTKQQQKELREVKAKKVVKTSDELLYKKIKNQEMNITNLRLQIDKLNENNNKLKEELKKKNEEITKISEIRNEKTVIKQDQRITDLQKKIDFNELQKKQIKETYALDNQLKLLFPQNFHLLAKMMNGVLIFEEMDQNKEILYQERKNEKLRLEEKYNCLTVMWMNCLSEDQLVEYKLLMFYMAQEKGEEMDWFLNNSKDYIEILEKPLGKLSRHKIKEIEQQKEEEERQKHQQEQEQQVQQKKAKQTPNYLKPIAARISPKVFNGTCQENQNANNLQEYENYLEEQQNLLENEEYMLYQQLQQSQAQNENKQFFKRKGLIQEEQGFIDQQNYDYNQYQESEEQFHENMNRQQQERSEEKVLLGSLNCDQVKEFLQDTNFRTEQNNFDNVQNDQEMLDKILLKQSFLDQNNLFNAKQYFGGLQIRDLGSQDLDSRLQYMFSPSSNSGDLVPQNCSVDNDTNQFFQKENNIFRKSQGNSNSPTFFQEDQSQQYKQLEAPSSQLSSFSNLLKQKGAVREEDEEEKRDLQIQMSPQIMKKTGKDSQEGGRFLKLKQRQQNQNTSSEVENLKNKLGNNFHLQFELLQNEILPKSSVDPFYFSFKQSDDHKGNNINQMFSPKTNNLNVQTADVCMKSKALLDVIRQSEDENLVQYSSPKALNTLSVLNSNEQQQLIRMASPTNQFLCSGDEGFLKYQKVKGLVDEEEEDLNGKNEKKFENEKINEVKATNQFFKQKKQDHHQKKQTGEIQQRKEKNLIQKKNKSFTQHHHYTPKLEDHQVEKETTEPYLMQKKRNISGSNNRAKKQEQEQLNKTPTTARCKNQTAQHFRSKSNINNNNSSNSQHCKKIPQKIDRQEEDENQQNCNNDLDEELSVNNKNYHKPNFYISYKQMCKLAPNVVKNQSLSSVCSPKSSSSLSVRNHSATPNAANIRANNNNNNTKSGNKGLDKGQRNQQQQEKQCHMRNRSQIITGSNRSFINNSNCEQSVAFCKTNFQKNENNNNNKGSFALQRSYTHRILSPGSASANTTTNSKPSFFSSNNNTNYMQLQNQQQVEGLVNQSQRQENHEKWEQMKRMIYREKNSSRSISPLQSPVSSINLYEVSNNGNQKASCNSTKSQSKDPKNKNSNAFFKHKKQKSQFINSSASSSTSTNNSSSFLQLKSQRNLNCTPSQLSCNIRFGSLLRDNNCQGEEQFNSFSSKNQKLQGQTQKNVFPKFASQNALNFNSKLQRDAGQQENKENQSNNYDLNFLQSNNNSNANFVKSTKLNLIVDQKYHKSLEHLKKLQMQFKHQQ